jgi:hypothetical protein
MCSSTSSHAWNSSKKDLSRMSWEEGHVHQQGSVLGVSACTLLHANILVYSQEGHSSPTKNKQVV